MHERLQKVLARAGFASRRGAEQLMAEGRVTVNGETVRELGTKADPTVDDVRVDGVRVKAATSPVYIVLNKPRGVVSTRRDPGGRQTVMDLVPGVAGLFPVGRLDVTTEGLILLTNDGSFAERVAHPRYEVPRVYHAKVHGIPDAHSLERLQEGLTVDGEHLKADRARVLESGNNAWVELTLHEGKQHEVRRLLEAVGHPVSKLRRVAVGPVHLKGLGVGEFRALRADEVAGLLRGEGAARVPRGRLGRRGRTGPRRPGSAGAARRGRPAGRLDDGGRERPAGRGRGAAASRRDERSETSAWTRKRSRGEGREGRGQGGGKARRGRGVAGRGGRPAGPHSGSGGTGAGHRRGGSGRRRTR